jgi:hypothetical protein
MDVCTPDQLGIGWVRTGIPQPQGLEWTCLIGRVVKGDADYPPVHQGLVRSAPTTDSGRPIPVVIAPAVARRKNFRRSTERVLSLCICSPCIANRLATARHKIRHPPLRPGCHFHLSAYAPDSLRGGPRPRHRSQGLSQSKPDIYNQPSSSPRPGSGVQFTSRAGWGWLWLGRNVIAAVGVVADPKGERRMFFVPAVGQVRWAWPLYCVARCSHRRYRRVPRRR